MVLFGRARPGVLGVVADGGTGTGKQRRGRGEVVRGRAGDLSHRRNPVGVRGTHDMIGSVVACLSSCSWTLDRLVVCLVLSVSVCGRAWLCVGSFVQRFGDDDGKRERERGGKKCCRVQMLRSAASCNECPFIEASG